MTASPPAAEKRSAATPTTTATNDKRRGIRLDRLQKMSDGKAYLPESRNPEEYRAEVDEYLEIAAERVVACAMNRFEQVVEVPLALRVVNTGERNLESVEIVVTFSGAVLTHEEYDIDMPTPPREWGPWPNPEVAFGIPSMPSFDYSHLGVARYQSPGYTAENTGSTTIEFDPFELRPHKEYDLDKVPLVVGAQLTRSIRGSWTATAKNRDGTAKGFVTVPLADTMVSIGDLMSE